MRGADDMDGKSVAVLRTLRTPAVLANSGMRKMMDYYDADYVANVTYEERYEREEEEDEQNFSRYKESNP